MISIATPKQIIFQLSSFKDGAVYIKDLKDCPQHRETFKKHKPTNTES